MKNTKTQLANEIIEGGQPLREIQNYLSETYDDIKQVELFDRTFTDRIQFIKFIQEVVCPSMIKSLEEWKLDQLKEYNKVN
jgi:hypothetical protein